MKKCFKCGDVKELSEFYGHPQMPDGHVNKCKVCNKIDVTKNYMLNRDKYILYERKRYQTPERKSAQRLYQKRSREKDPLKYKAVTAVGNAVRDGRLIKLPCEDCGEIKSQAHHDDYSKPLEVRWLCRRHHLEIHGKIPF